MTLTLTIIHNLNHLNPNPRPLVQLGLASSKANRPGTSTGSELKCDSVDLGGCRTKVRALFVKDDVDENIKITGYNEHFIILLRSTR